MLSVIFRAKIRQALEQAKLLDQIPRKAWKKKWVVHCRHAGDGQRALLYVARYIHRIAITNSRLESFDPHHVSFRYRDSRSGQLQRCMLSTDPFIRRFLQHVLPPRFIKIRCYGLFSPRCRNSLERARSLLGQQYEQHNVAAAQHHSAGDTEPVTPDAGSIVDRHCPVCHVRVMTLIAEINRQLQPASRMRAPPNVPP